MLQFISRLFSNEKKVTFRNETDLINELITLSNGVGMYANMEPINDKISKKGNELLEKIEFIEKEAQVIKNSEVYYWLAIAFRNYTAWYKRGEERKFFLKKIVHYLEESINLDHNVKSQEELARILLQEKQVRDIKKSQSILDELKFNNDLRTSGTFLFEKSERLNQEEIEELDFKSIDPLPAFFRERRKRYRQSVRDYKNNLISKVTLEELLIEFYNLAILYSALYKEHDANSAVSGMEYDNACKKIRHIEHRLNFSYLEHGKIKNSNFISTNDWKTFEDIFGKIQNTIDAYEFFKDR